MGHLIPVRGPGLNVTTGRPETYTTASKHVEEEDRQRGMWRAEGSAAHYTSIVPCLLLGLAGLPHGMFVN